MIVTFEVDLDYGEEGPDEGEPTPTNADVAMFVRQGMAALGFSSVDVKAKRL